MQDNEAIPPQEIVSPAVISMIYMTEGGNRRFSYSIKSDKMVGIVINDCIHWVHQDVATYYDFKNIMSKSGLVINDAGRFGVMNEDREVAFTKKVTRISKPNDYVLREDSSYYKRSIRADDGDLFWSEQELFVKYPRVSIGS